ncbi:GNAT family N-acetyltransferase [Pediococcus stilesii]|uniref:Acetyltransferase n=1 Tax=Pediococcus stilesii TaxID=331679 RepID=A0A0R2L014_9LACO|nr:GNAT family N-acetyltransferase [Pediococcus stilesii]KRN93221.1 acetyltransferase [Pediococcus stilesii]
MKFKLRYFLEKDFKDYQRLIGDPEIAEPSGMKILENPFEQWMAFKGMLGRQGFLAIADEDDHVIGGIFFFDQQEINHYELGYLLKKNYWNQGIMSKAVYFAIKNFEKQKTGTLRLSASVFEENVASSRVLEKNSFQKSSRKTTSVSGYNGQLKSEIRYEMIIKGLE